MIRIGLVGVSGYGRWHLKMIDEQVRRGRACLVAATVPNQEQELEAGAPPPGFRDEAVDYAVRLATAGVPTELHMYPGLPHGFQAFSMLEVVQNAARDRRDWLRRIVARP